PCATDLDDTPYGSSAGQTPLPLGTPIASRIAAQLPRGNEQPASDGPLQVSAGRRPSCDSAWFPTAVEGAARRQAPRAEDVVASRPGGEVKRRTSTASRPARAPAASAACRYWCSRPCLPGTSGC